jgi:hypothetical protein
MGFGLIITSGDSDSMVPLPDAVTQWLVEARVEMELSNPTRFALRFEDDICEGQHEIADGRMVDKTFFKNSKLGLFVKRKDDALECLVFGPVTKIRSSSMLGGPGSWVEIHGEDRRAEMKRVGVRATYVGRASAAASSILTAYGFTPSTQDTLIQYDGQKKQLTQRGTDLAFIEDIARRNNMEFWIEYAAERAPVSDRIKLTETAKLRTSPPRAQPGDVRQVPTLVPDAGLVLRLNPPRDKCPSINRFDTRIDFEKPTAASGFVMSGDKDKEVVAQIVADAAPVDSGKLVPVDGVKREVIAPPEVSKEEAFLAQDAIVFEQSWFVEVDCSATLEQLDFLVRPHQIVEVANAGDALSGGYQVMEATHVVTSTDHFMDFTIRANGLGGAG